MKVIIIFALLSGLILIGWIRMLSISRVIIFIFLVFNVNVFEVLDRVCLYPYSI